MICPVCNSEVQRKYTFLGRLGSLNHYRCPACGIMWNKPVPRKTLRKIMGLLSILLLMVIPVPVRADYDLTVNGWKLMTALERVENVKGDVHLVGDKHMYHKAYGLLQIRKPYLTDVNRIAGKDVKRVWGKSKLTMADMKIPVRARWAAKVYLSHYGARYERITGFPPTMEVYAKIHNGGPNGWKRGNLDTHSYWVKVKQAIMGRG
jgi:uncharacterized Zn finger protein